MPPTAFPGLSAAVVVLPFPPMPPPSGFVPVEVVALDPFANADPDVVVLLTLFDPFIPPPAYDKLPAALVAPHVAPAPKQVLPPSVGLAPPVPPAPTEIV